MAYIYGTDGDDLWLRGGSRADTIYGLAGNDFIWGYGGDDTLDGDVGSDVISGGAGNDTIIGAADWAWWDSRDELYGESGNDLIVGSYGDDLMKGGTGADELYGDEGSDQLYGEDGDDYLRGDWGWGADLNGNDTLNGGSGNDTLVGGAGNDLLVGGADLDTMYGEGGDDTYYVDSPYDDVSEEAGQGIDTIYSSVDIKTEYGALAPNVEKLVLYGSNAHYGEGNDLDNVIYGNETYNYLFGGQGNDILYSNGNYAPDSNGNIGTDWLSGGNGNDYLFGGDGTQVLVGDSGQDYLSGGSGADYFWFATNLDGTSYGGNGNVIVDFNRSYGDKIDLRSHNHNFLTLDQISYNSANGELTVDYPGADMVITLAGAPALDLTTDIILI